MGKYNKCERQRDTQFYSLTAVNSLILLLTVLLGYRLLDKHLRKHGGSVSDARRKAEAPLHLMAGFLVALLSHLIIEVAMTQLANNKSIASILLGIVHLVTAASMSCLPPAMTLFRLRSSFARSAFQVSEERLKQFAATIGVLCLLATCSEVVRHFALLDQAGRMLWISLALLQNLASCALFYRLTQEFLRRLEALASMRRSMELAEPFPRAHRRGHSLNNLTPTTSATPVPVNDSKEPEAQVVQKEQPPLAHGTGGGGGGGVLSSMAGDLPVKKDAGGGVIDEVEEQPGGNLSLPFEEMVMQGGYEEGDGAEGEEEYMEALTTDEDDDESEVESGTTGDSSGGVIKQKQKKKKKRKGGRHRKENSFSISSQLERIQHTIQIVKQQTLSSYDEGNRAILSIASKQTVLGVEVVLLYVCLIAVLTPLATVERAPHCLTRTRAVAWSLYNVVQFLLACCFYMTFSHTHRDYKQCCKRADSWLVKLIMLHVDKEAKKNMSKTATGTR